MYKKSGRLVVILFLIIVFSSLVFASVIIKKESDAVLALNAARDQIRGLSFYGFKDDYINNLLTEAETAFKNHNLEEVMNKTLLIKKRQDGLYSTDSLMRDLEKLSSKYLNDRIFNTAEYNDELFNITFDFANRKYDLASEEALNLEVELEFKLLTLFIESENKILDLESRNFTVNYLNDLLYKAKSSAGSINTALLKQKIEQIREGELKQRYLVLIDGLDDNKKVDFDKAIDAVKEISKRKEQILYLKDQIDKLNIKKEEYSKQGYPVIEAEEILNNGIRKFNDERYDEAESLLNLADSKIELNRAKTTIKEVVRKENLNFLIKNWKYILIWLLVLLLILPYSLNETRIFYENRRCINLELEEKILQKLIKKTQVMHFKTKAPSSTYNIKLTNYLERLNYVQETVPVVKASLEKLKKIRRKFSLFKQFYFPKSRKK